MRRQRLFSIVAFLVKLGGTTLLRDQKERPMSILDVAHLSHSYGGREIFEDVSFRLEKGEHVALVGANGEGKSTFMSIITGKLSPDDGKITWRGVRRLDTWTSTQPLRRERPSAKRCARPFRILSMRKRKCLPLTIRWRRFTGRAGAPHGGYGRNPGTVGGG